MEVGEPGVPTVNLVVTCATCERGTHADFFLMSISSLDKITVLFWPFT